MTDWVRIGANVGLAAAGAAAIADGTWGHGLHPSCTPPGRLDDRATANGILLGSGFLWPVVFDMVVGYHRALESPIVAAGLLVPLGLVGLQMSSSTSLQDRNAPDDSRRVEAQIVISTAFSIGLLLLNLRNVAGPHTPTPGGGIAGLASMSRTGLIAIVIAVLICLVIVVPAASLGGNSGKSDDTIIVQTVQRAGLNYSFGLVLAGVLLAFAGVQ